MKLSTREFDVERHLDGQSIAKVAQDLLDDGVVSDDDIPWDEIIADARSGEQGIAFEPEDLLRWAEEDGR